MSKRRLNLTSELNKSESESRQTSQKNQSASFIGIKFVCCSTYGRIYRNAKGNAYAGHCPKCAKPVRVNIRPGGSSNRFFSAG